MKQQNDGPVYYLVDDNGCVMCVDGGYHVDESFGKFKGYKRLKAAQAAADAYTRSWGKPIHVRRNDGEEMEETGNDSWETKACIDVGR